jgi:hypothetical protein
MEKRDIESIPLYPEGRPCKAPSTDGILSAFLGLRRTRLHAPDGEIVRTFHDLMRPVLVQLLEMTRRSACIRRVTLARPRLPWAETADLFRGKQGRNRSTC